MLAAAASLLVLRRRGARSRAKTVRRAALHRPGRRHARRAGRRLHGADRQRPLQPAEPRDPAFQPRHRLRQGRRLRPRHRRFRRGDPDQPEPRARLSQSRQRQLRQARLRSRHRRLQPGDPARAEERAASDEPRHRLRGQGRSRRAPSPTTTRRSSSIPISTAAYDQPRPRLAPQRQHSTAPSPTSTRPSGSIRRTPRPTTTAASRYADKRDYDRAARRLRPGAQARSELRAGLSQPRPALARPRRTTTAPSPISTPAIAARARQRRGATTRAAPRSTPRASSTARIADFDKAIALDPDNADYLRQPRQRLARPRPVRPRRRGLRQGDRARAGLCLRLLQPLAGALSRRPLHRGAGRCRQGRRAQRRTRPAR